MTKKHFEQAAAIIAEEPDLSRGAVAAAFVAFFAADNPRFDKVRFVAACDLAPSQASTRKRHPRPGDPFALD